MKYKIGHKVEVEAVRPFCTGGPDTITEITYRFDEKTGEQFPIYKIGQYWWRETINGYGTCYDNPQYMYDVDFNYYEEKV